ncbi:UNVERIFIED_CONTAM: hypothetical protein FKN15_018344 [Acipenser sinensis]
MNTRCPPKHVPSADRFFSHYGLTVQPPQSYSVRGQHSSGQLIGKPAGARPDYRSCCNFSNYRNRFSMPGDTESLWYSWNIGPAHIISFSTEVYFYLEYGLDLIFKQYSWLEKDLEEANKPENRRVRPWIITMAHRPMYCSNDDKDDCTKFESYVFNGSMEHPYVNPRAPVHIITGSAGCREKHDGFIPAPRDWSAFRSTDYGYTRMQILNSTHLYLEQVSDDQVRGVQLPCSLPYGPYTELRSISLAQEVYCIYTSHCCLQRKLRGITKIFLEHQTFLQEKLGETKTHVSTH